MLLELVVCKGDVGEALVVAFHEILATKVL